VGPFWSQNGLAIVVGFCGWKMWTGIRVVGQRGVVSAIVVGIRLGRGIFAISVVVGVVVIFVGSGLSPRN
jgi:hypothetical protein